MKKNLVVLLLALALGGRTTDAKANVFASSMNIFASSVVVDFNGTFPATISYNLNQNATSVVITIKDYPGRNVVKTITIESGANGALVGFNDVTWDGSLDAGGTATSGIFTIEIDARDRDGATGFKLISFDQGPDSWYWSSSGVAANTRQTSPDFGTVYVTERTGGTSGNPGAIATPKGLYLHDAFGRYRGFQQNIAFAEGNSVIDWAALAADEGSPFGATVGPDDRVYLWVLASNRDNPKHGGVAVGDATWSASSVETILDFSDFSNHHPISDAIVVGLGADRVLYTVEQTSTKTGSDNDSADDGDGFDTSEIKRYALGEAGGLFSGSGEVVISTATIKNAFRIAMDAAGFLYVVQQSYAFLAVADTIYGLSKWDISGGSPVEIWHVDLDAAPSHNDVANGLNGQATNFNGLALDEPRGRIYVTRKNAERPLHNVLGYDMETGDFWMSFSASESVVGGLIEDLPGGGGSSIRDVGVDAAGNVLIVNSSFEALRMYSPPDGSNSFTTHSAWAIDVSNSTVIATPDDVVTAVEDLGGEIPQHYTIAQNYPNPFNAGTTIEYSLPIASDVRLVIYDIQGREVASLVQTRQHAGTYSVQWLGRNNYGQGVASGIYFYKLTALSGDRERRSFNLTKRLVYFK